MFRKNIGFYSLTFRKEERQDIACKAGRGIPPATDRSGGILPHIWMNKVFLYGRLQEIRQELNDNNRVYLVLTVNIGADNPGKEDSVPEVYVFRSHLASNCRVGESIHVTGHIQMRNERFVDANGETRRRQKQILVADEISGMAHTGGVTFMAGYGAHACLEGELQSIQPIKNGLMLFVKTVRDGYASYIRTFMFGRQAERYQDLLHKGDPVYVSATIRTNHSANGRVFENLNVQYLETRAEQQEQKKAEPGKPKVAVSDPAAFEETREASESDKTEKASRPDKPELAGENPEEKGDDSGFANADSGLQPEEFASEPEFGEGAVHAF